MYSNTKDYHTHYCHVCVPCVLLHYRLESLNTCHSGPSAFFFPVASRYISSSDLAAFFLACSRNSLIFFRCSATISGIFRMFSSIMANLQVYHILSDPL